MNQPKQGRKGAPSPLTARGIWARRITWTGVALLLVTLFCGLTFQPLWHPRTHLLLLAGDLTAAGADPLIAPRADFVVEDLSGYYALSDTLYGASSGAGPRLAAALRSREDLPVVEEQLKAMVTGYRDVLLVYASVQGVSEEGDAWLLCSGVDAKNPFLGRVRLRNLISQLAEAEAGVKLLLLDAGRTDYDPLRGMLQNDFLPILEREVKRTEDPALWVFASHSAGERSHLSYTLRRSVFNFFAARGLRGAADENGDSEVDLRELTRYVTGGTGEWVRRTSGGKAVQTPRLIWGGKANAVRSPGAVLAAISPQPADAPPEPVDIRAAIQEERKQASLTGEAAEVGRTQLNSLVNQQIGAALPGGFLGQYAKDAARNTYDSGGGKAAEKPKANATEKEKTSATDAPADGKPPEDSAEKALAPPDAVAEEPAAKPQRPVDPQRDLAEALELCRVLREPNASRARPLDYAPHLWRALEQELAVNERRLLTGAKQDAADAADQVARIRQTLADLHGQLPPEKFPRGSLGRRIAESRPVRFLPSCSPHSFAAAELWATLGGQSPPETVAAKIAELDQIAANGAPAAFEKWAKKLEPADDRWSELRFARRMADRMELDWRTVQSALRTMRSAEQAAAATFEAEDWTRETLARGDRSLRNAEHAIFTAPKPDRERIASDLTKAREEFQSAQHDLQTVLDARRLVNEILYEAPWVLQWTAVGGPLPTETVAAWLDSADALVRLLEHPSADRLPELRTALGRAQAHTDDVHRAYDAETLEPLAAGARRSGDSWRIELLLETPLVTGALRSRLSSALLTAEEAAVGDLLPNEVPRLEANPGDTAPFHPLRRHMDLQTQLARLGSTSSDARAVGELSLAAAAERYAATTAPGTTEAQIFTARSAWTIALQDYHRNLSRRMEGVFQPYLETNSRRQEETRSTRLWSLQRGLYLIDPRLARTVGRELPLFELNRGEVFEWLLANRGRMIAAADDAPAEEALALARSAADYKAVAAAIPRRPPISPDQVTPLEFVASGDVSLSFDAEKKTTVQLTYHGVKDAETWLIAQYDESLLKLTSGADQPVYLPRELGLGEDPGPLSLSQVENVTANKPATVVLHPGAAQSITLDLRRLKPAPQPTRVLLQAFTKGFSARRVVEVDLPAPDPYQLTVKGISGAWSPNESGTTFHPFPNRTTKYQLALGGDGTGDDRIVDVAVYALAEPLAAPLPRAALSASDSERLFGTVKLGPLLGLAVKVALKNGQATPLPFLPPKVEPAAPPPPPPEGEAPAPPPPAAGKPPPPRIEAGLLVVITDPADQRSVFRRIDVSPQRPQRYVRPRVGYNPAKQRVEIQVAAQDPRFLPPGIVNVNVEPAERLPDDAERRLDGQIKAPNFSTDLHFEAPEGEGRFVVLRIHVDGFPRAFVYRVPCDRLSLDVPPETDFLDVRITALLKGRVFTAPAGFIPVKLEVDAPAASFRNPPLLIEAGVDRNRDRELFNENTIQLTTERYVEVRLEKIGPGGEMTLDTLVSDFELALPDNGLDSGRANVLAKATLGDLTAWSAPLEVVFDRDPPRVREPALSGGGQVELGKPAEITLTAADADLSGIARVEGMFDKARSGEIPEGAPTVLGSQQDDGRWLVQLPTDDLSPGSYNALLRAIDRAGNKSSPLKMKVQVYAPLKKEEIDKAALSEITGTVIYGGTGQAGVTVTLSPPLPFGTKPGDKPPPGTIKFPPATTDSVGKFRFKKVPPGEYVVKSEGLIHNRNRKVEANVKAPQPKDAEPLKLKFK